MSGVGSTEPPRSGGGGFAAAGAGKVAPRKSLGQHFLAEHSYIDRIVRAMAPRPDDFVIAGRVQGFRRGAWHQGAQDGRPLIPLVVPEFVFLLLLLVANFRVPICSLENVRYVKTSIQQEERVRK